MNLTITDVEARVAQIAATPYYDLAESLTDDLMIDLLEHIQEITKAAYAVYLLPQNRFKDED